MRTLRRRDVLGSTYHEEFNKELEVEKEEILETERRDEATSVKKVRLQPFEKIKQTRQERALKRWDQQQQEWGKIELSLASKFKKKSDMLVMERSQKDHREKVEEQQIISQSIPMHERGGEKAWELSLRKHDMEKDVGSTIVSIGGTSWPYPLFLEIKDKETREFETIRQTQRNPLLAQEGTPTKTSCSMGVRTLENPYVKTKYRKHIKKFLPYDPVNQVDNLQVYGINVAKVWQNPDSYVENYGESSSGESEDQDDDSNSSMYDEDEVSQTQEPEEIITDQAFMETEGPAFKISSKDISFSVLPNEMNTQTLTVTNVGTFALQYRWMKKDPIVPKQSERAGTKFQLISKSKGVLLPNTREEFTFSFLSGDEGIYSCTYDFLTTPDDEASVELRGICIATRDVGPVKEFDQKNSHQIRYDQMHNLVQTLVSELPEPDPPITDDEQRKITKEKLLCEQFTRLNNFPIDLFTLNRFINLSNNIHQTLGESCQWMTWDLSINSLIDAIQRLPDATKERYLSFVYNLISGCQASSTLQGKGGIYPHLFAILKKELNVGIDQIVENVVSLKTFFADEDSSKKKKPAKKTKVEVTEEQKQKLLEIQQKNYQKRVFAQCEAAMRNSILDNVVSQWDQMEKDWECFDQI